MSRRWIGGLRHSPSGSLVHRSRCREIGGLGCVDMTNERRESQHGPDRHAANPQIVTIVTMIASVAFSQHMVCVCCDDAARLSFSVAGFLQNPAPRKRHKTLPGNVLEKPNGTNLTDAKSGNSLAAAGRREIDAEPSPLCLRQSNQSPPTTGHDPEPAPRRTPLHPTKAGRRCRLAFGGDSRIGNHGHFAEGAGSSGGRGRSFRRSGHIGVERNAGSPGGVTDRPARGENGPGRPGINQSRDVRSGNEGRHWYRGGCPGRRGCG